MTFKQFHPGRRSNEGDSISIKKNILFFNASLTRNNDVVNKQGVEMFIEDLKDTIRVGFLFVDRISKNSLKLSKATKGDAKFCSAMGLFKELKKISENFNGGKFTPKKEKTDVGELLVIEIEK